MFSFEGNIWGRLKAAARFRLLEEIKRFDQPSVDVSFYLCERILKISVNILALFLELFDCAKDFRRSPTSSPGRVSC
jgi:hypothetical protein